MNTDNKSAFSYITLETFAKGTIELGFGSLNHKSIIKFPPNRQRNYNIRECIKDLKERGYLERSFKLKTPAPNLYFTPTIPVLPVEVQNYKRPRWMKLKNGEILVMP